MYKKLFELSGKDKAEIARILNVSYQQIKQYQKSKNIDVDRFVSFGKLLGFDEKQLTNIVVDEIREVVRG
jgi:hypothetical protein